jgi:ADP-ribose pyrophosphatase YjhB (NUDIX family)
VIRNGLVLLARNRGQSHYSLPGGGIRIGESVGEAVARELHTELRLTAANITRLPDCDFDGSGNRHHVCLVEADGEPVRRRIELGSYMWWDMKKGVPVLPHVNAILERLGCVEVTSLQESSDETSAAKPELPAMSLRGPR